MDLNVATATEDALIDYCIKKGEKYTLGDDVIGAVVVKVTDKIVAKWGCTVTAGEAAMHEFAYKNLDRNIVRVPQLYRFVRDESGAGYLFMEYIPGQNLADLDIICHQDIIPRIAKIVQHLGQIQAPEQKPGPINDQGPRGYLWGDEGVRNAFGSVDYLNDWLNRRLTLLNEVTKRNDSVDISPYPLVLCHMDLCRRNMILGEDGKSIYLLDWGHAGFFPRFYEVATLSCLNPYDEDYEQPLIEAVESLLQLTDDEKRDMKMIHYARAASLRWSFPDEDENTEPAFDPAPLGTPPPLPSQRSLNCHKTLIVQSIFHVHRLETMSIQNVSTKHFDIISTLSYSSNTIRT